MQTNYSVVWFAAVLAVLCPISVVFAQETSVNGTAMIAETYGSPQYSKGDEWFSAKVNTELEPGTTFCTGVDSHFDAVLKNGDFAVGWIGLRPETVMKFEKLSRTSNGRHGDTSIILDLKSGTIIGGFHGPSSNSFCEIHTPTGMARIVNTKKKADKYGTEFVIEAVPQIDGKFRVTFSCLKGEMICSATIDGQSVSTVLSPRKFWPTGSRRAHHSPAWLSNRRYHELEYLVDGPIISAR